MAPTPLIQPDALHKKHLVGLDIVRAVSAAAIVYLHSVGGTTLDHTSPFTRYAVPFFTASAVYLAFNSAQSKTGRPLPTYIKQRFLRIYIPFLVWTGIYLVIRQFGSMFASTNPPSLKLRIFWTGSSHQLWFLPFILVVTIATYWSSRWIIHKRFFIGAAILMAMLGIVTSVVGHEQSWSLGYTAALSYQTLPAACWTLTFMCVWAGYAKAWRLDRRVVLYISATGFIAILTWLQINGRFFFLENISGLLALGIALTFGKMRVREGLLAIGGFAYGIYLAHVLFIEGIQDILTLLRIQETAWWTLSIFVFSLLACLALCWVLSRFRWAWLFGVPPAQPPRRDRTSVAIGQ